MVAAACYQKLPSADLWWLLANGRLIVDTGRIPGTDPFSWSAPAAPWHNDQWLSGLIFYILHGLGGLIALHLFKAVILCTGLFIGLDTGRRQAEQPYTLIPALLLCLVGSSAAYFFDVRAYLWTYLGLSLLWRWLQLEKRVPLWRIACLFTLWANLHGGVSSGLLLLGVTTLSSADASSRKYYLKATLLALACCCLNPSGWWILLHPIRLLGSPWSRYLNEWQPVWRRPHLFYWHGLHLLAWIGLWVLRPLDRWDRPLIAMALFSLTGWRHIPLFSLLALPRACVKLAPWFGAHSAMLFMLPGLYWAGLRPFHLADPGQSMENQLFPRWACQFLRENHLEERLFHPYGLGGYLCWALPPGAVCVDGRAVQVYPLETYREYFGAALDPAKFAQYCERHQISLAMLFANPKIREGSVRLIDGQPGWREIYRDDLVVLVSRRKLPTLRPIVTPYSLTQKALENKEPVLLLEALRLDPEYEPALFYLKGK